MKKEKWTPGPWRVFASTATPPTIAVDDSGGRCVVHWLGFDAADQATKTKQANARLIAAAPEMYDVLSALIRAIEFGPENIQADCHLAAKCVLAKVRDGE